MTNDISRRIRERAADGKVITVDFGRPAALVSPESTGDFESISDGILREDTPVAGTIAAGASDVASSTDPHSRAKLAAFSEMVEDGMVMVTLDSRRPGVEVPDRFRGVPALNLNFSHRFFIEDFAYDEFGIRATLAFESGDFFCIIPWRAVYVMSCASSEKVFVAPDDMPDERRAKLPQLLAAIEASLDDE